ncbi:hypothetical protein FOL47_000757 [Perkinsus chesapeaki]|uniref:Uncharacterized protein n=1 Tax=Perkinsus chesapeaki TaxID=330153 RepID=A0A7J6MM14_PERCH|nr:hypothetical protein FOL47_000757 [Perkinsus chesapeaki]
MVTSTERTDSYVESKPTVATDTETHAGSSSGGNFRKRLLSIEAPSSSKKSSSQLKPIEEDSNDFLCDEALGYEPKWFDADESDIGYSVMNMDEPHGHERILNSNDL